MTNPETDAQRLNRTMLSSLDQSDKAAGEVQAPGHPRVTLESMQAKIADQEIWNPSLAPHMTIVAVHLENGFILVGKSAPADPANFNAELGLKFAMEDAIRQMWQLEGYLLRENLYSGALGAGTRPDGE